MAELIRVLHSVPIGVAQKVVDSLSERRNPLVWSRGEHKLVLDPTLTLADQVLLLLDSTPGGVAVSDLLKWCTYSNRGYFVRVLRKLQDRRLAFLSEDEGMAEILPPEALRAEKILTESMS